VVKSGREKVGGRKGNWRMGEERGGVAGEWRVVCGGECRERKRGDEQGKWGRRYGMGAGRGGKKGFGVEGTGGEWGG